MHPQSTSPETTSVQRHWFEWIPDGLLLSALAIFTVTWGVGVYFGFEGVLEAIEAFPVMDIPLVSSLVGLGLLVLTFALMLLVPAQLGLQWEKRVSRHSREKWMRDNP